ncbi:sulfatase-like hydrolase/transferase [Actinokineospora sp. 24-640]
MEGRPRRIGARLLTLLAGVLVVAALVAPNDFDSLSAVAFLRLPVEALAGAVLFLVLPGRARGLAAVLIGLFLGLLAVVKVLDIGFDAVLHRPFDLVLDWPLLGPAVEYTALTSGRVTAVLLSAGAVALAAALAVLITLAVSRLSRAVVANRPAAVRAVVVLAVVCLAAGAPGGGPLPPVASTTTVAVTYQHARQVGASLQDRGKFAEESAVDRFGGVPGADLLTALRGKDVVVVFVESFGRVALEHPGIAPTVGAALEDGTRRLTAAGFASRSAYLTSPTSGGGSWLAHATLLSGLWIDNQQRYNTLVASDRRSVTSAFRDAGWRTVGVMPGVTRAWPDAAYFGYDEVHAADDMGYRGPGFGFATMPDQYALAFFERSIRSRDREPVMAVIPVLASHAPWSPVPRPVEWSEVGDGSVFASMPNGGVAPDTIWKRPPDEVRADYARSLEYSLGTVVSYSQTYGDDDLVVIMLGDHQPATAVTGGTSSRDAPIAIATRDTQVLSRLAHWQWTPGLRPDPGSPVWPMNAFRDEFLAAFSPLAGSGRS